MPKFHEVAQNSEAWEALRRGIPTASSFDKIITPHGKPSVQWKEYAHRCIAEKILKRPIDFTIAGSNWMQRGHELEGEAVNYYEAQTGKDTQLIGFVTTDDGSVGCSPDRLVGNDGLMEIKCPAPHTQIGYLLTGGVEEKYTPQLQGQLYVTGREWVDILSYDPDFPDHVIIRVTRNDFFIKTLAEALDRFNSYVADGIIDLAERWKGINRTPDALEILIEDNDARLALGY